MVLLIGGSSHTGKTLAAQRVLEKYSYPYLSIDHLKMGLIRSGMCSLTPESSDGELTPFLWNIIRKSSKPRSKTGKIWSDTYLLKGIYFCIFILK